MRIEVVGKNVQITDAIRTHIEAKLEKLPRFFDGVQQITVTVEGDNHHQHGTFAVEVVADVIKHDDFVARATDEDLYKAIDAAAHKSERQIKDFKERLRDSKR